jgi:hypothetical protein
MYTTGGMVINMKAIVKDAEFRQQIKRILEVNEILTDACTDVNAIMDDVLTNAIVDYAVDNRLKCELSYLNNYVNDIQNALSSSKKNMSGFIEELEQNDNLI